MHVGLGMRLKLTCGQFIFLPAMFASVRDYPPLTSCHTLMGIIEFVRYECRYTRVESGLALVSAVWGRMRNDYCAGVGRF
jgi:hypothetical protein